MSWKHPFIVTTVSYLLICSFNLSKLIELRIFHLLGVLALLAPQMQTAVALVVILITKLYHFFQ